MSLFRFIASDDSLIPNIDLGNSVDSLGRIVCKSENDLHKLCISKSNFNDTYEDARYYTNLPEMYELSVRNTKGQIEMLINHLQKNVKANKKYEIHKIWLANAGSKDIFKKAVKEGLKNQIKATINVNELVAEDLMKLFDENISLRVKVYK